MTNPPAPATNVVSVAVRIASGLVGVSSLALGATLARIPADRRVAAPACMDAPPGCVVVTDEFSYSIPLALTALAALLLLIAITGRLWTIKFGDNSIAADSPRVVPATTEQVDTETKPAPAEQSPKHQPQETSPSDLFADLYTEDPAVAKAIDDAWRDWYDMTVTDKIVEYRRSSGKGNHSWFVKAKSPGGEEEWVRISKGGRGGGITTRRGE